MRRLILLLLISIICSAYPVMAQQRAVEFGGAFDASATPNKQVYASYYEPMIGGFRSYTTLSLWQIAPMQIAHAVTTGVEHPIYTQGWFTLAGHSQVGYALSQNVSSIDFNAGGAITIAPASLKHGSFVIIGGYSDVPAVSSISKGVWYPRVSVGFRYELGGGNFSSIARSTRKSHWFTQPRVR